MTLQWHPTTCVGAHDENGNCLDVHGSIVGWPEDMATVDPGIVADLATVEDALDVLASRVTALENALRSITRREPRRPAHRGDVVIHEIDSAHTPSERCYICDAIDGAPAVALPPADPSLMGTEYRGES